MSDCGKIPKGDKGQRYEVRAQTEAECEEFIVGWTERKDGEPLVGVVNAHPSWHSPQAEAGPTPERVTLSWVLARCRERIASLRQAAGEEG